jgi:dCTP deaminase
MGTYSQGVMPDRMIWQMIEQGQICSDTGILDSQVQPSQLDLTVGRDEPLLLFPGDQAIVPLNEQISLPEGIYAKADTRSHIAKGNVSVSVGTMSSYGIYPAYSGRLYAHIETHTFPAVLRPGDSIAHLRFFRGEPGESIISPRGYAEALMPGNGPECYDEAGDRLRMRLALQGNGRIAGYMARPSRRLLDLSGGNCVGDFFEEMPPMDELEVNPGEFYLLETMESLGMGPCGDIHAVAEMQGRNDDGLRVNRAGFIEYGSGPSRQVLEIEPEESCALYHGQPVCSVVLYRMCGAPARSYGQTGNGNLSSIAGKLFVRQEV